MISSLTEAIDECLERVSEELRKRDCFHLCENSHSEAHYDEEYSLYVHLSLKYSMRKKNITEQLIEFSLFLVFTLN